MDPRSERAARSYARSQQTMLTTLAAQLVQLWRALIDPRRVDESWPAAQMALSALVQERRQVSSAAAVAYYVRMREAAGVVRPFVPVPAPRLPDAQVATALTVTGPVAFKRAIAAGATQQRASHAASTALAGAAARLVEDAGRTVVATAVRDDDDAIAWGRMSLGTPCSWCAMLISRGPVYGSKDAAISSSAADRDGYRYHDHCRCQPYPIFSRDDPWSRQGRELYEEWRRVTADTSGAESRRAWRRYWDAKHSAAS